MAMKYSSSIERALSEATRKLSFDELNSKQKEVVVSFVDTKTVQLYITTCTIKSLPRLPTGYTINVLAHTAHLFPKCILRIMLIFHAGQSKNGARDFY